MNNKVNQNWTITDNVDGTTIATRNEINEEVTINLLGRDPVKYTNVIAEPQPSSVLDADLTPEQIADLQEFLDAEEANPNFMANEDGSVTVKITEGQNIAGALPVQNGGGGYISCAVSGVGCTSSLGYMGTSTSMANLCFQADRTLLSTELVNGTVEQIYHCDSPVTLACWPPRDTSWYEKEIWAPKGDDIVLISSVKGRKVPEHFEWEDGEEA